MTDPRCSFCAGSEAEVERIFGAFDSHICDRCVEQGLRMLDDPTLVVPRDLDGPDTLIFERCSFCRKRREEVRNLVSGPDCCICDHCLDLCRQMLVGSSVDETPVPSRAPDARLRCGFCARQQDAVRRLVAGSSDYICDQCVERCARYLSDPSTDLLGPGSCARVALGARCSFCGKEHEDEVTLIPSPGKAAICNECIELCEELIAAGEEAGEEGPTERSRSASPEPPPVPRARGYPPPPPPYIDRLPPALRAGDRVAIVAPAGAVDPEALARGIERIRARGYEVVHDEGIFERERYLAGSDERRARELLRWLEHPSVRAVLCARGGFGSARTVEWIIRNDPQIATRGGIDPRILVGHSDLTYLLNLLSHVVHWVTFHGPMVGVELADSDDEASLDSLLHTLSGERFPGSFQERPLEMLAPGGATGRLLGGNLSTLMTLRPPILPNYSRQGDTILFLEEVGEPAYRVDRMLTQLRDQLSLWTLRGIVIGHLEDVADPPGGTIRELLMERLGDLGVPVAMGLEAGHGRPNRTLPLGVNARLDTHAGTLHILDPVVRTDDVP